MWSVLNISPNQPINPEFTSPPLSRINSAMHVTPTEPPARNNRVLVIDDNPAIHADVRKILCPQVSETSASLDALELELLGSDDSRPARPAVSFVVEDAHQGREGLEMVKKAVASKKPY